ncbi:MAG TPA: glycosyltransferase family A protein [Bryobacteraceae bacterium]|nr:glycosyltransferase family A protein [Bryobacteraceae bacterium]
MRISVVIPLYNKAERLPACLDSIARQTFRDFEAIVVDDGSTDDGPGFAQAYPDPRFRLIRQPNAGPGAARNRGLAEARGEYIAFLDADDVWLPVFLETNAAILDAHPTAASVSSAWIDYPGKIPCAAVWSRRGISEGLHRLSPSTPLGLFAAMVTYMTPCTTIARASVLRRLGGFQGNGCRYAEDTILWLKIVLDFPVCFHLLPLTELHREASELSGNYARPRPVESFLEDPDEVASLYPAELRPLLARFYALRACKTACMLSYWGEWRRARELLGRLVTMRDWRVPLFFPAQAGSTPLGAAAAYLWRRFRGPGSRPAPPRLF